jgi:uncharacterized membrane protein
MLRTYMYAVSLAQVQIVVHYAFLVSTGRLLKLPYRELLLASNANVGGPTTAGEYYH